MNYIKIKKNTDFQTIIDSPILITGDERLFQDEISVNAWGITLAHSIAKKITAQDLLLFFDVLVKTRSNQLAQKHVSATLYLWFDEQGGQLCINLISGCPAVLPFGCTIATVNSPKIIFDDYLKSEYQGGIPLNSIDFLEYDNDDNDNDDDSSIGYVLKVFSVCLT